MATTRVNALLRELTRGMPLVRLADRPDRELVERLLQGPDEAAFEALVRRHGPMVYRVCWRALKQHQDTEDAFQATFLLLARKLPSVRKESLASWLHGVARRVALEARKRAARRRRHEGRVPAPRPVPPDDIGWEELRGVLDAELAGLPERHRLPLVLCYLEGRTQEEAARQLGWSKSTLLRRLAEGRAALGGRLARRGVVWPAALAVALLPQRQAAAALAPRLIDATLAAAAHALGWRPATSAVSPAVASLVEGATRAMLAGRLKAAFAALVLLGGLALGAAGLVQAPPGGRQAAPRAGPEVDRREPVAVRGDAQVGQVAWDADGKVVATVERSYERGEFADRDGPNPRAVLASRDAVRFWDATGRPLGAANDKVAGALGAGRETRVAAVAFSPDRKHLAVVGSFGGGKVAGKGPRRFVKILDAETWGVAQEIDEGDLRGAGAVLAFSPDGKTLALGGSEPAEGGAVVKLWDIAKRMMTPEVGSARPPLGAPAPDSYGEPPEWEAQSLAFSPGGTALAAGEFSRSANRARIRIYDAGTGTPRRGWELGESRGMVEVAFTADGKRLVSASGPLRFWDADTCEEQKPLDTDGLEAFRVAASPDGLHIAASGVRTREGKPAPEVRVWDARAGGLVRVVTWEDPGMWGSSLAFSRDGTALAVGAQTDADAQARGGEKVRGELRLIPLP
jgi:RNA polymerase sigma factor (sigma-70 family)